MDVTTAFTDAELNIVTTLAAGDALATITSGSTGSANLQITGGTGTATKIELYGGAGTYSRTRSSAGSAYSYLQTDASGANATLEIRSNWVTAGNGSAILNLYTDNTLDGYRLNANGVNGRFNIRRIENGTAYEMADFNDNGTGRTTFYQTTDYTKGSIRLSASTGAAGGGVIAYDSGTGVYALTGSSMTIGSLKLGRRVSSVPATSATPGETGDFIADDSFLYFYGSTGWRRVAVSSF